MLPGNRKCSMMVMLNDVIGGHQAIYSKKERKKDGASNLQLAKTTRGSHVAQSARETRL